MKNLTDIHNFLRNNETSLLRKPLTFNQLLSMQEVVEHAIEEMKLLDSDAAVGRAILHAPGIIDPKKRPSQIPSPQAIHKKCWQIVKETYRVHWRDVCGRSQRRRFVLARRAYAALVRCADPKFFTYAEIGRRINRHHSSILHQLQRLDELCEVDHAVRRDYMAVRSALEYWLQKQAEEEYAACDTLSPSPERTAWQPPSSTTFPPQQPATRRSNSRRKRRGSPIGERVATRGGGICGLPKRARWWGSGGDTRFHMSSEALKVFCYIGGELNVGYALHNGNTAIRTRNAVCRSTFKIN